MEKIGRNDPCSCGSGLKFKKCCENKKPEPKKWNAQKISLGADSITSRVDILSRVFQRSAAHETNEPTGNA